MALHTPFTVQPVAGDANFPNGIPFTGQEIRQALGYMDAPSVIATEGIVSGFAVTQHGAGANLTVDVASGKARVSGDDSSNQGVYTVWNDATVNVGTFTVPGSGTFTHRLILRIEDKLSNGVWTGYQGNLVILPDIGAGLVQEPNTAITLATVSVSAGQSSVTNANITDYRQFMGRISAVKGADQGRSSATAADDADLQLTGLKASAVYELSGFLKFDAAATNGLAGNWNVATNCGVRYHAIRNRSGVVRAGASPGDTVFRAADQWIADGNGAGIEMGVGINGWLFTGTAPCWARLQWCAATSGQTVTLHNQSFVKAERVN